MNHESNSNNYKKIIFGNKHQTSNDNIFVNEYTFDSPLWKQLTYAPEILKKIHPALKLIDRGDITEIDMIINATS